MDYLPIEPQLAGVGGVDAGENFPERALPRTVFPDQRVARTALDRHADPVEREHAGEALGDRVEFEVSHRRK